MKYQVWTKEEYGGLWKKVDCEDLEAAMMEIDKGVRASQEPMLTTEVTYKVNIEIKVGENEATESEAKSDQNPAG